MNTETESSLSTSGASAAQVPDQALVDCQPVHYLGTDEGKEPADGMALCLSGGGYRAMLFHTGVLWRLNEVGYLPKLMRISSVSGGSITAGVLAMNWQKLRFQNDVGTLFEQEVVTPIRRLASNTIDVGAVVKGAFWFGTIGNRIADYYRKYLFGNTTLQDITDQPRFVINATNTQSGVLWRFSKPYMRDYRVGEVVAPKLELAIAVAASSAFPPILSPVELNLGRQAFTPNSGTDLQGDEYRNRVVLADGGIYDNLGLETAWKRYKTIFVSDAGMGFSADADPWSNWISQAVRVLFTIDNQVRSLRRRQVVGSFVSKLRTGAFWSIENNATAYPIGTPLDCPFVKTSRLAKLSTRLKKLDDADQEKLINWGYAVCDLSLRQHFDSTLLRPERFPYNERGV